MIKLKFVVGTNIMNIVCEESKQSTELKLLMGQHIQVVNEKILSMYSKVIGEDIIQTYVRYMCDSMDFIDECSDAMNELEELVYITKSFKSKYKIVLLNDYKINIFKKHIIVYNVDDVLVKQDTLLNRYSIPYQRNLSLKERVPWFNEFICDFFEGEDHIIIMDPHIMNTNGILALEKIYLPIFSKSKCSVDIYFCSRSCFPRDTENGVLNLRKKLKQSKFFNASNAKICVLDVINKKRLHDRTIRSDKYQMQIPAGLDIIVNDIVDTVSSIITSNKILVEIPKKDDECKCIFKSKV